MPCDDCGWSEEEELWSCWVPEESRGEVSPGDAADDDVEKAELLFEAVDDVPSLCLTPPEAFAPPGQVPVAEAEVFSIFTPGLMSSEPLLLAHRLEPVVSWWCMNATPMAAA
jgi:hypothetical protein